VPVENKFSLNSLIGNGKQSFPKVATFAIRGTLANIVKRKNVLRKIKSKMGIFDNLFSKKSNDEIITSIPESWTILKGENDGKPMLIRKNVGLDKIAGNRNYSISCGIAFELLFPDENGLPIIENEPELNNLEDEIFQIYESDLNSIVALIITTSGFREFVLYTKDAKEFMTRLKELKSKYNQYELTNYTQKDKNWSTYNSF